MTENELELLSIIRNEEHPEQALKIAMEVITSFLVQSLSCQEPSADSLRELA